MGRLAGQGTFSYFLCVYSSCLALGEQKEARGLSAGSHWPTCGHFMMRKANTCHFWTFCYSPTLCYLTPFSLKLDRANGTTQIWKQLKWIGIIWRYPLSKLCSEPWVFVCLSTSFRCVVGRVGKEHFFLEQELPWHGSDPSALCTGALLKYFLLGVIKCCLKPGGKRIKMCYCMGMVTYAYNSSLRKLRREYCYEFQASLGYRDPGSKNKNETKE